ncbi:hypothetical protein PN4B1_13870 [Paenibacillus naphthalenovorans]|nr:hypothetical protein PN4B1_13870 [Paenibacillus naphthalenovorans]
MRSHFVTLERMFEGDNLRLAYKRVVQNGGAPGVDGVTVVELQAYLNIHWETVKAELHKRVLKLIRAYLNAGVMDNGGCQRMEEGTPQGGPLTLLLANILLDELDKELTKRQKGISKFLPG